MNNLITINENGQCTARELYEFLELAPSQFARWAKSNIENDEFYEEGNDWHRFDIVSSGNKTVDYKLTTEFAKHLSMMSKSSRGKIARNYFVEAERRLREPLATHVISQAETDAIAKKYALDMSMIATKYSIEILRPSQASRIKMLTTVHKNFGLATNTLPSYTEEAETRSATELLESIGSPMSTITFNKRLLSLGLLEVKTRNGKGNTKKSFKSLTDEGLFYGKNLVSPMNERETQAHFYPEKFKELLRLAVGV